MRLSINSKLLISCCLALTVLALSTASPSAQAHGASSPRLSRRGERHLRDFLAAEQRHVSRISRNAPLAAVDDRVLEQPGLTCTGVRLREGGASALIEWNGAPIIIHEGDDLPLVFTNAHITAKGLEVTLPNASAPLLLPLTAPGSTLDVINPTVYDYPRDVTEFVDRFHTPVLRLGEAGVDYKILLVGPSADLGDPGQDYQDYLVYPPSAPGSAIK